jgi:glycosyltransferase involved in cell wall biosynthesis
MRILFIPLEPVGLRTTNERLPSLIRILSKKHHLLGLNHYPFFGTNNVPLRYMLFCVYFIRTLGFGLRYRRDFDLIFCELEWHALIGSIISIITGKPCVWDTHSVEPNPYSLRHLVSKIISPFVKKIIVVCEMDKRILIERGFPAHKIVVIPTAADLHLIDEVGADKNNLRKVLGLDTKKKILIFIGHRYYGPNKEAADWINEELAPALSEKFDDIQVLITGYGPKPTKTCDIVNFIGFVPNIYEYILASDVCLAPIWRGVGMLTKVIDYMSCAKPTVVTPFVLKGIPQLKDGDNIVVAQSKSDFIQKTIKLLEHLDVAQAIGIKARKTIEKFYTWSIHETKLNDAIETCLR